MRFFKKTNFDFMGLRGKMYFISTTIIAIGLISLLVKGVNFGLDFRGGTEVVLSFASKPDYAQLREGLGKAGFGDSEIKSFGGEKTLLIRTAQQGEGMTVANRIEEGIRTNLPGETFEVLRGYKISPKVGNELKQDAVYAIIATLVVILTYIAIRYHFMYGVGAVLALFHDVLLTIGLISLLDGVVPWLNLEITLEIIAAFLTIVGLSTNDTVVVFDRIRENSKIYKTMTLKQLMNKSLNDVLSRTLITMGTIIAVLVVLLFAGGEVTRGFAFTLVVGMTTGTYSSIYIASAIVLDNSLRKKKE